ncbi:MAG: hypothetical protein WCD16_11340 [Paracoccaceae bacterium]
MKAARPILTALAAPALWAGMAAFSPAAAFTAPAGCATFLTLQMKGCQMALFWRCDAQKDRVWQASFDDHGPLAVSLYDREFQWLDTYYTADSTRETLAEPGRDPVSMSELLATGKDSYGFTLSADDGQNKRRLHVVGNDRLTGQTVEIDGVKLRPAETEVTIRTEDGTVDYQSTGRQYVSAEMRLFFLGTETVMQKDGPVLYDNTPVDFIFPGEPGFGATRPLYECETVTSDIGPADAPSRG